ncbi:hypothetical protein BLOT_012008 [Blomia tropicalis]|nr:hypothetical protein BLOT_012008 [Blomia tropicalis]
MFQFDDLFMTRKFTLTIKLANDLKDYENKDKKFSIRNHSNLYYIHFAKLNCLYDSIKDVFITWKRINLVVPLNKEESKWNYFMVKVHQLYDTN